MEREEAAERTWRRAFGPHRIPGCASTLVGCRVPSALAKAQRQLGGNRPALMPWLALRVKRASNVVQRLRAAAGAHGGFAGTSRSVDRAVVRFGGCRLR